MKTQKLKFGRIHIAGLIVLFAVVIPLAGAMGKSDAEPQFKDSQGRSWVLSALKDKWPELFSEHEILIKRMRSSESPNVAEFLSEIALGQTRLDHGEAMRTRLFAISTLASATAPNTDKLLGVILASAPPQQNKATTIRLRARAAFELMQRNGQPSGRILAVLDDAANEGVVYCPYPLPKNGTSFPKIALSPRQKALLTHWKSSPDPKVQLEAAYCWVQAGEKPTPEIDALVDRTLRKFKPSSPEESAAQRLKNLLRVLRGESPPK